MRSDCWKFTLSEEKKRGEREKERRKQITRRGKEKRGGKEISCRRKEQKTFLQRREDKKVKVRNFWLILSSAGKPGLNIDYWEEEEGWPKDWNYLNQLNERQKDERAIKPPFQPGEAECPNLLLGRTDEGSQGRRRRRNFFTFRNHLSYEAVLPNLYWCQWQYFNTFYTKA